MNNSPIDYRNLSKYQRISKEEESSIIDKIRKGDISLREKFILSNIGLVTSVAKDFFNICNEYPTITHSDIIEVGNMGLIKAVDSFNPSHNNRFSTYAVI